MIERISRRGLLKGLVATAAGLLLPADVAAEPERRVWALGEMPRQVDRWRAADPLTDIAEWMRAMEPMDTPFTRFPERLTIGDYTWQDGWHFTPGDEPFYFGTVEIDPVTGQEFSRRYVIRRDGE